jgi:hypothetical protein
VQNINSPSQQTIHPIRLTHLPYLSQQAWLCWPLGHLPEQRRFAADTVLFDPLFLHAALPPRHGGSLLHRILVEADNIPTRITKPSGNLRSIRANLLHNLATIGHYIIDSRRHAIDHYIHHQPRLR